LFGEAAPDFTDPLGLLAACHRRILDHCALLERMRERLPLQGVDADMQAAAGRVHRYFAQAAPQHHADEEQDLFPLLREVAGLGDTLAALERGHRELERCWQALAPALRRLEQGRPVGDWAGDWNDPLARFLTAYRDHVETEDHTILPAARRLLGAAQLAAMGRAMARRRGVNPVE
jgi:hemerythrin-like domain-containing protein